MSEEATILAMEEMCNSCGHASSLMFSPVLGQIAWTVSERTSWNLSNAFCYVAVGT